MTTLRPKELQRKSRLSQYDYGLITEQEYYRLVAEDSAAQSEFDYPYPLTPDPLYPDEVESALDHELELQFLAWELEYEAVAL